MSNPAEDQGQLHQPDEIVLMSDPRILRIPVRDCGEPLIDCRSHLLVDERRCDPAGNWARLRAGVAERLLHAQELLPPGWRWLLTEGYRPPALQQEIFDGHAASLRKLQPGAPEERIRTAAARWVAPLEAAGHVAGAAIDLTVCMSRGCLRIGGRAAVP